MSNVVKCGHCDGKGVCQNCTSSEGKKYSCETCFKADGGASRHGSGNMVTVKCSVCNGTGWIRVGECESGHHCRHK